MMVAHTFQSSKWFSRRACGAHLAIVVWVPGCLIAAWWQATVAMAGNGLSYLYAVEWPVFALFGIVLWWNFVHDDPEAHGTRRLVAIRRERREEPQGALASVVRRKDQEDDGLRAYNDYLEQLARQDRRKTWRAE